MWALGLIVGSLIGAVLAQGAGALVGAIVGVAIGIVVGQQRKGVKRRIETLESQMLNLETQISALDERWSVARSVATAPGGTAAQAESASARADAFTEARSPVRLDTVPGAMPAAAFVSTRSTEMDANSVDQVETLSTSALPVRQGGRPVPATRRAEAARDVPPPAPPSPPSPPPAWLAWVMGGNTLARIGVLLLSSASWCWRGWRGNFRVS